MLDYATHHCPPGLPPHSLAIYVSGIYRLIRNFSLDHGLVKNCRVIVVSTGRRLITVKALDLIDATPNETSANILIPRITFHSALPSGHTLLRRQFPLAPAYASTFNSCQGLTLDTVGIDLTSPVFSHGQLYTALSRVRHRDHACILCDSETEETINVTYHEILL
ncbi:hypothetical protein PISMIDRAFT_386918 [Pisolithus microcarpus 441]|uniref:ATP-dependent DNA helicase n=1 Tax=Pisolithus microcarpus 441 TaxID=765257 RepID=A0A0C9YYF6_9AGAM|nr:hypothetical protein PISMIDRAFT_386918 [Pisolithus microcarpus 441]